MTPAEHRARVVAAVERHAARIGRGPAGYFALTAQHPHVVGAGASLACLVCGATETAPIPRLHPGAYSQACERWIGKHKDCGMGGKAA